MHIKAKPKEQNRIKKKLEWQRALMLLINDRSEYSKSVNLFFFFHSLCSSRYISLNRLLTGMTIK